MMRKRNHRIWTYLNDEEYDHFLKLIEATGVSKEGFVRSVLSCDIPPPLVPDILYEVLRELRYIGNNLNQIARVANATGDLNHEEYKQYADMLVKDILDIKQTIARPIQFEKVVISNGDYKDMGNKDECQ